MSQMSLDTCTPKLRTHIISASRMFDMKVQQQLLTHDVWWPRLLGATRCTRADLSLYHAILVFRLLPKCVLPALLGDSEV